MKKNLKVSVIGPCGSGKSSLLYFLKNILTLNGFDVKHDGGIDYKDEKDFNEKIIKHYRKTLTSNKFSVTLEEVQVQRGLEELLSLYDFLGYKAGKLGGRMVNNIAKKMGVKITQKWVIGESYEGFVMTYPYWFLQQLKEENTI